MPRLLLVPLGFPSHPEHGNRWGVLSEMCTIEWMSLPDETFLFEGRNAPTLGACVALARRYKGFDYVVANYAAGFIWRIIFRLAGIETPFALLPRYNAISPHAALCALMASRTQVPGDTLWAGSVAAATSFARLGFSCSAHYPLGIDDAFRPMERTSESYFRAVCATRIEPDKHVLELVRAFERIREPARLSIAFQTASADYLRACRSAATSKVSFIDAPNREALARLYSDADLFVSAGASVFETFGRSPVEAMACGTPPLVCDYDGFRDTVPEVCGWRVPTVRSGPFHAPDVERFAEQLMELVGRDLGEERRQKCAANGARYGRRASLRTFLSGLGTVSRKQEIANELRAPFEHHFEQTVAETAEDLLRKRLVVDRPSLERYQSIWFSQY